MEPCVGSAPTTCRLQGGCSTNWANTATVFIIAKVVKMCKVCYNVNMLLRDSWWVSSGSVICWNRLVAMTRDCKSLGFGLRRFESYFQHQVEIKVRLRSFDLCKSQVRAVSLTSSVLETSFWIGSKYLTGKSNFTWYILSLHTISSIKDTYGEVDFS